MKEFKLEVKGQEFTFRIKELNGIQALSYRNFIANMDKSVEDSTSVYYSILEQIEVLVGSNWVPCKDGEVFLPTGLENSPKAILDIMLEFVGYVRSFF